jgi:neutral ceramidase
VVEDLQEKYGMELFRFQNVLLSGTHTHSGPAGYIQYLLYGITSLGFHKENFQAIVGGIVQSIERAYADLQPGKVFINKGELLDANINRSPTSYLANPEEERAL